MKLAFLGVLFLGITVANAQQLAPPLPKYLALPYPPFSRYSLSPISRSFYDMFTADVVKQFVRLDSSEECPKTNALLRRVYDRVVQANGLDQFFALNDIHMNLIVLCPNGNGSNGLGGTGLVVISAPFVKRFLRSEDEIALLISHELSHVLQASDYKYMTNKLTYDSKISISEEDHADENGLVMVANAGFDPTTAMQFQWMYARSLPLEESFAPDKHSAPVLRPVNSRYYISKHRLPSREPTYFDIETFEAIAMEAGLQ